MYLEISKRKTNLAFSNFFSFRFTSSFTMSFACVMDEASWEVFSQNFVSSPCLIRISWIIFSHAYLHARFHQIIISIIAFHETKVAWERRDRWILEKASTRSTEISIPSIRRRLSLGAFELREQTLIGPEAIESLNISQEAMWIKRFLIRDKFLLSSVSYFDIEHIFTLLTRNLRIRNFSLDMASIKFLRKNIKKEK